MMEWIKLKCNLLENEKIRLIRAEKGGDELAFIWVGLLCLAGSQEQYGVFRMNEKPLTRAMLARLLAVPPRRMERALTLFLSYGMVSEENGTLYLPGWESHQAVEKLEEKRRQDRERKRRSRNRQIALARGTDPLSSGNDPASVTLPSQPDPLSEKDTETKKETEKDADTDADRIAAETPAVPSGDGKRACVKVSEKPLSPEKASAGNGTVAFTVFWDLYPRKEGRGAAEKAWAALAPGVELAEKIFQGVRRDRLREEWRREGGRYVPFPGKYLAERRWEDELPGDGLPMKSFILAEAWERAVARQEERLLP